MLSYLYIIFFYFSPALFGQFRFFCDIYVCILTCYHREPQQKMGGMSFEECEVLTEKMQVHIFLGRLQFKKY